MKIYISRSKFKKYTDTITRLREEFTRFFDFREIGNQLSILHQPFSLDVESIPSELTVHLF